MLSTSDGGSSWSGAPSTDSNVDQPGTVDCVAGTTTCVATAISNYGESENVGSTPEIVDYDHTLVFDSSDSGSSWSNPTVMEASSTDPSDDGMDGYSLDCLTSSTCAMVAGLGLDSGYRHPGEPQSMLMGTPGAAVWSGSSPFGSAAASTYELLGSVSCTSTSDCWAAGDEAATGQPVMFSTTDGGATWSAGWIYAVSGYGYASNIACQDGTTPLGAPSTLPQYADCQMIVTDGGNGYGYNKGEPPEILSSTDGGATWNVGSTSNLDGVLFKGITCPTGSVCLAYGWIETNSGTFQGIIEVTTDGGST
jgi:hypothetical protein